MRRIHAFVRILPRRPLQLAARAALALLAVLSAVVSTPSTQAQTLVTLYSFKGAPDGAIPYGGLILDASGHLYGTTELGGLFDSGTVFKLDGSGNETVLHSFSGSSGDGAYPFAALIRDPVGNLYGTTYWGGSMVTVRCSSLIILARRLWCTASVSPPRTGQIPIQT